MAVGYDTANSTSGTAISSLTLSSFTIASNSNRVLYLFAGNDDAAGASHSNWVWNTSENPTEIYDAVFNTTGGLGAARLVSPTATTANAGVTFSTTVDTGMLAALSLYDSAGTNSTVLANTFTTANWWGGTASSASKLSVCWGYGNAPTTLVNTDGIPEYIAVGTASQSAGATGLTPTGAPTGIIVGDMEFCSIATENNETISCSGSGWNKIGSTVQQNATWQEELWYRFYDGSNVNPAFTWSSSVGCSARRWIFRDTAASSTLFGFHTTNSGATSTHSITGSNATGDDSTVMYLSHAEANTALGADADYTERFDAGSATGPYRLVVGNRDQATSGAGSANFSATGANASWVMRLLEIFNATNGDQSERTKIAAIGSWNGGSLATETGDTYNTFGFVSTGASGQTITFAVDEAAASSSRQNLMLMGCGR